MVLSAKLKDSILKLKDEGHEYGYRTAAVLFVEDYTKDQKTLKTMWEDFVYAAIMLEKAVIDEFLYKALVSHNYDDSSLRKFAKMKVAAVAPGQPQGTVLEWLANDSKNGFNLPKVMSLLTNPTLYKDKGKKHATKKIADEYQQAEMEREFEEEQATKAAEIRQQLADASKPMFFLTPS